MTPLLSVLIPSIPSRLAMAVQLYHRLQLVMKNYDVEVLLLCDNHHMTIGEKRDALKNLATGKYICFCDDDDRISDRYWLIAQAAYAGDQDVITFKQTAIIDGQEATIDFDLTHPNDQFVPGETVKRSVWHVCAWKRELVQYIPFPHHGSDAMYGEDWRWCRVALEQVKTQYKIDEIIHTYIHTKETTAAPLEI